MIQDIVNLSQFFSEYIIVLAESKDFEVSKNQSFKQKINNILELCTNSNIIMSSLLYGKKQTTKELIYNLNLILYDYITKLNWYAEIEVFLLEINSFKRNNVGNHICAKKYRIIHIPTFTLFSVVPIIIMFVTQSKDPQFVSKKFTMTS